MNTSTSSLERIGRLSPSTAVLGIIVVTACLRLLLAACVGLGYGESYYFSCAAHPSLSYFDHPGLSIWLASAAMAITGQAERLVLRLPSILMFAGTTWMMYRLTARLFGSAAGFWAVVVLNISAVFTVSTGTFLQPDGALMFFWLACVLCLTRVLLDESPRHVLAWWLGAGVTLGLAMLSKYHAVFLAAGALLFMLTTARGLRSLRTPGPWLAALVAIAVFSPVLIWAARIDWLPIRWQFQRGNDAAGLRLDWLGRNILGQAMWVLPWIWPLLLWQLVACFRRTAGEARRFLGWLAAGPIVAFTAISAWWPIGLHFHWGMAGYLMLLPPLGAAIHRGLASHRRLTRGWLISAIALSCISITAVTTHAATGWWRSLGPASWLAKMGQMNDPTLEMLDWRPLEDALRQEGLLNKPGTFLVTNRYFTAGKADFAVHGTMPVLCMHHYEPLSHAFFHRQQHFVGQDGIFVTTKEFYRNGPAWEGTFFESVEYIGSVPLERSGRVEMTLELYLGRGFKGGYPLPYP